MTPTYTYIIVCVCVCVYLLVLMIKRLHIAVFILIKLKNKKTQDIAVFGCTAGNILLLLLSFLALILIFANILLISYE